MSEKFDCTELLKRVFKVIADSHFNDHKMIQEYCANFRFKRTLGADIANYIQNVDPEYFNKLKEKFKEDKGERIKEAPPNDQERSA